jgi:hypothetical protein
MYRGEGGDCLEAAQCVRGSAGDECEVLSYSKANAAPLQAPRLSPLLLSSSPRLFLMLRICGLFPTTSSLTQCQLPIPKHHPKSALLHTAPRIICPQNTCPSMHRQRQQGGHHIRAATGTPSQAKYACREITEEGWSQPAIRQVCCKEVILVEARW